MAAGAGVGILFSLKNGNVGDLNSILGIIAGSYYSTWFLALEVWELTD